MSLSALTERAMVLNVAIGVWKGYRLDREASREVTEKAGANADAARVNKHIIPKDFLAPIETAANAIRQHFHSKTLPWKDNGDRIITRQMYLPFIEAHEALVGDFNEAVETFLTEKYPVAIEKASFRMGALFDPSDYPHASELRRKFYVTLDPDAISTSSDFRVALDGDHVERVKAKMEEAASRRFEDAMADVWKRIGTALARFQERTADPKGKIYNSTVDNVTDLIDLIPGLNVLDDPNIEEVRQMIAKNLGRLDADDIRKDGDHRAELAIEAQKVLDKMSGFMGAFGNG